VTWFAARGEQKWLRKFGQAGKWQLCENWADGPKEQRA
jgi:hypothetical protein